MNIQNINNKTIYQPSSVSDVKSLHSLEDDILYIDIIELELNVSYYHSEHGIIVGSIIELSNLKNIELMTTNKDVQSVLN